ncbi:microtubule-associated protein 65-5 [Hibiscus trionum]|uniref:Microtubule-associated protein 65-5 n=1 Tax=Hibiscus trionum TaxID=183268 RepID=A0A9W7H3R0_HIBTR|nr:microtubule-associated protein 65-5 [Hibiscus trionum]
MTTLPPSLPPSHSQTTCASLLQELQVIWDEIGESDVERDKMLLELEQECLDIYRRKVETTRKSKADLHHTLAQFESEIAKLVAALGEHSFSFSRGKGALKQQISYIRPVLEELRSKKKQRVKEFTETQSQIAQICAEIAGNGQSMLLSDPEVDERDLTVKKLGELKSHLQELQNEKIIRLQKVHNHISMIHELSVVMSFDFLKTVSDIHGSLIDPANGQSKSISNDTLAKLTGVVNSLQQEKQKRLQKLQCLGSTLIELWDLLDTPPDERKRFEHVTSLISSSVDEVLRQGSLGVDIIEQVEVEVQGLKMLKASKMKELVFKRQDELEEIYRGVHLDVNSDVARQILINLIESDNVDLSNLLSSMDDQIAKAKQEALSRKDILDKVDKWKHASEEEKWLDDYEKDENRYSAGRGVHKNLKRAEKARSLVGKLPSLVENLTAKAKAWELEKGIPFLYDKASLLNMLEEYTVLRQAREDEKRRSREQKRLQEQFAAEQEALFGSRPKKPLGQTNAMVGTPTGRRTSTPIGKHPVSSLKERRETGRANNVIPLNFVALAKEDPMSRGN